MTSIKTKQNSHSRNQMHSMNKTKKLVNTHKTKKRIMKGGSGSKPCMKYGLDCKTYKKLKHWSGKEKQTKIRYHTIASTFKDNYNRCEKKHSNLTKKDKKKECDKETAVSVKSLQNLYGSDTELIQLLTLSDNKFSNVEPTYVNIIERHSNKPTYSLPIPENMPGYVDDPVYQNVGQIPINIKARNNSLKGTPSITKINPQKHVSIKHTYHPSKELMEVKVKKVLRAHNISHEQKIKDLKHCSKNDIHRQKIKERCINDLNTLFKITKSLIIYINDLLESKSNDQGNTLKEVLKILTRSKNQHLLNHLNALLKKRQDELKDLLKNTNTENVIKNSEDLNTNIDYITAIITALITRDYPRCFDFLIDHERKLQSELATKIHEYDHDYDIEKESVYSDLYDNKFTTLDSNIYNNYLTLIELTTKSINMLKKYLYKIDTIYSDVDATINNNTNDADYYNKLLDLKKANLIQFETDITNPHANKLN